MSTPSARSTKPSESTGYSLFLSVRSLISYSPALSVHLVVREHLSLTLNRDGGVSSLSLKGDLDLRISDPAYATLMINLPPPSSYAKGNDLQFKTHPNVDKNAWASKGEVRLKEGKKGFPVGQGLGVLKWRLTGTDESVVPISSESVFRPLLELR